jgi:Archaeal enzymes of ATP-grasp superfamily
MKVTKFLDLELLELEEPNLRRPSYMIVGIPDAGLVGEIATEYLINSLGMREFAEVSYPNSPYLVQVINGVAKSPIRAFYSSNVIALNSWSALNPDLAFQVSGLVMEIARKYAVDTVISITGVPVPNRLELDRPSAFWISSGEDLAEEMSKVEEIRKFGDGYIVGPYAKILLDSKRTGIRNLVITVESLLDLPDPEAAIVAIEFIGKYIGVKVDTSKLEREAENIRSRIRELMEQTKRQMPSFGRGTTTYA